MCRSQRENAPCMGLHTLGLEVTCSRCRQARMMQKHVLVVDSMNSARRFGGHRRTSSDCTDGGAGELSEAINVSQSW